MEKILLVVLLVSSIFFIIHIIYENNTFDIPDSLKISFKRFLIMYSINKDAWEFNGEYTYNEVIYIKKKTTENIGGFTPFYIPKVERQIFYFGIIDYFKFRSFRKHMEKTAEKQRKQDNWLEVVKSFQKDINNYQEDYLKDLQKKIDKI